MIPAVRLMVRVLAAEFPGATITVRTGPRRGDRYLLRRLEFVVTRDNPLTMAGPSGIRRSVTPETFAKMERVHG